MSLNAVAAQAAQDDELRKLDEIQDEASFSRQEAGLEALRAEGKFRAKGIEGRSAAKVQQDIKADYGRQMAMLNASVDSAGLETRSVLKEIARDKASAMTPLRKKRKRENQASGKQSSNYDLHHKPDGSVVKTSTKNNRNVWKHKERT